MAIHKLFSKILLTQTYHTTCVSFSCKFTLLPESTGNTREAVATSRHDWKVVDWDVMSQHKQTNHLCCSLNVSSETKCMQLSSMHIFVQFIGINRVMRCLIEWHLQSRLH